VLAAVGVYGVIAYSVQHRTHDIGVRVALGALQQDVCRMVLFEGSRLAIVGVFIGIVGALALTPLLASLLYGVRPSDAMAFFGRGGSLECRRFAGNLYTGTLGYSGRAHARFALGIIPNILAVLL
jgi:ABC-type antimicrobial peptide transport system permease subunit